MEEYLKDYPMALSVEEVSEILGVGTQTVRHLINRGDISGVKVGRLVRVPKWKLIEYLERGVIHE